MTGSTATALQLCAAKGKKHSNIFFLKKWCSQIVCDARSSEQIKKKTMLSIQGLCISEHGTSIHEDRVMGRGFSHEECGGMR
jgi:hypothetical protein